MPRVDDAGRTFVLRTADLTAELSADLSADLAHSITDGLDQQLLLGRSCAAPALWSCTCSTIEQWFSAQFASDPRHSYRGRSSEK